MEIRPEQIVDLFNDKLAGRGKIKRCPTFFLPMTIVQDFITMRNYPKFDLVETWSEYFDLVAQSTFLTTQFTPSIAWLLKPENAFKVFSGQYDDKDSEEPKKDAKNNYYQAQVMASELFDMVIRAGSHGLMDLLANLEPIQRNAIAKFGRASEMLSCTEFQAQDIKKRLTTAIMEVLK